MTEVKGVLRLDIRVGGKGIAVLDNVAEVEPSLPRGHRGDTEGRQDALDLHHLVRVVSGYDKFFHN